MPLAIIETLRFAVAPYETLTRLATQKGVPFVVPLGAQTITFFADPAHNKEILGDGGAKLENGDSARMIFEDFLGSGSLLVLNGKKHIRHRQIMLPPFHGERMRAYGAHIQSVAREAFASLGKGQAAVLHETFQNISIEVIVRAVFGVSDPEEARAFRSAIADTLSGVTAPLMFAPILRRGFFGLTPWDRFQRGKKRLDALIYARIASRRQSGGGDDMLALLLLARDENGGALSDEELRDELVTLLMAGHETTATALAWVSHDLARDERPQSIAREEVLAAPDDPETVARLLYLDAVCKESLRRTPVIPALARTALEDCEIGGLKVKAGGGVGTALYLTHHDPKIFPEPDVYRPERFLEKKFSPYEFFPFGAGIRRCIGVSFAMYEMKLVLAELLRAHRFTSQAARSRPVRRNVTLSPKDGARVQLS